MMQLVLKVLKIVLFWMLEPIKLLKNLELSRILPIFAAEKKSPSYAKYLGQLLKSDLENNPARMRYAEAQASERGLYF